MKKAVILHGTDGTPNDNWFPPWLKTELELRGYEVWAPLLPNNHTPNRQIYNDFLFNSDWDFSHNLVIGHSSGAISVLNLLEDECCPSIKTAVLVSAWIDTQVANLNQEGFTNEQFKDLFPSHGFNFSNIKQKAREFWLIHGTDDKYCPLEQSVLLAKELQSDLITVKSGGHIGSKYAELPILIEALEARQLL